MRVYQYGSGTSSNRASRIENRHLFPGRPAPTFEAVGHRETRPVTGSVRPRRAGNALKTPDPNTAAFTYLIKDPHSPDATYTLLNLADETVTVDWPIPLDHTEFADRADVVLTAT